MRYEDGSMLKEAVAVFSSEEEMQRKHPLLYCRKPQKKVKYYGAD